MSAAAGLSEKFVFFCFFAGVLHVWNLTKRRKPLIIKPNYKIAKTMGTKNRFVLFREAVAENSAL